ncbi:50S ribosomal L23 [Micractinium conductrix]|uniref:Large ribosomal subunit protein uL23c n=1 Tax=Micractinium conductrix TaxID=554055 RepID=A0A2P6V8P8_9CHLO|nr:50S ribosomal L23 [Micractinium conductrix]|eukprot:PSC70457.1 50S ribosomal L23 [Micractinium conductrix]
MWRRLPAYLPNLRLQLQPLSEAQQAIFERTGFLRELVFKTAPSVSKPEIKAFLESVYGLNVAKVNTLNVEGKKKRGKHGFFRRPDFKKAFVTLNPTEASKQASQQRTTQPAMQHSGGLPPRPPSVAAVPGPGLPDPLDGHPVYVSHEERKEISDRKPGRKSSGHTYVVKFYLVDMQGLEHLAATGEDQGDAHYLYENSTGFPFLRANNKNDVRFWLDGIIHRSTDRAGAHIHVVEDEVPADPNKIHLPKFVGHTQDKKELADGRHRIEWYLLDEAEGSHLAIVGEEKETRDGHYLYRTQGIFDKALPLQVGNQREVDRWIDIMVTHGGIAPAGASGKAAAGEGGPTPAFSGARGGSRASQHARASGQPKAAGAKHDLLRQATSNAKKQKTVAGRLVDPDQEAREAVAAELQRWAQEEAQKRECAKRQALAYATDSLAGKEASAVKRCLAVLQQAAASAAFLPPAPGTGRGAASAGSHQQQQNLVDTLAALRELSHLYAPLSLVAMPELRDCLATLQQHQRPEIAQLAGGALEQWLRTAVAQAQVLMDPRYCEDPRSVLEAQLGSREVMDPVVAALTHRKMQPPPAAQPYERPASRLGQTATLGVALAGGAGGAAQSTPGGALSSRPSEASLQGLGEPGTGGEAMGGAAHAAGLASALAAQTAERRRLNLEVSDSPGAVLTAAGMRRQQQLSVSSSDEEEEEDREAAAAAAAAAAPPDDDPSSPPHSSELLAGGSDGALAVRGGRAGSSGGLTYAASVDLINAPIEDMASEQAEMLD